MAIFGVFSVRMTQFERCLPSIKNDYLAALLKLCWADSCTSILGSEDYMSIEYVL
jgi:hypothetical protein